MEVDDTDRQVVNALLADGRATPHDLSKDTGLSVPVVEQRLDSLERRGIVGDPEPVLDYDALGYDVTAVLQIIATNGDREALTERLAEDDRLITVYEVTGEHDVVAVGKFTDVSSLNERVGGLLTAAEVAELTTAVVRETVTEGEQFPLDVDDA